MCLQKQYHLLRWHCVHRLDAEDTTPLRGAPSVPATLTVVPTNATVRHLGSVRPDETPLLGDRRLFGPFCFVSDPHILLLKTECR